MDSRIPINFAQKLAMISEEWAPHVVAELNEYQFKLVKFLGEFVWHTHHETDEAFIVLDGEMEIGFRDGSVTLQRGEMYVVSRGIEHITRASKECHALVIEPRGVVNTGDSASTLTFQTDVWV
jgi:mannose-6-phosphate isomerase-like protein (cupin superfamily)